MNNTFISLCLLSGRQTADAIAKMILEVMKDFRLAKKVKFIVTDNGANICKAVKIIQEEKKKANKITMRYSVTKRDFPF